MMQFSKCQILLVVVTMIFGSSKEDTGFVKVQEHPRNQRPLHYGSSVTYQKRNTEQQTFLSSERHSEH